MEQYIKEYNEWLIKQNYFQMSNGLLNGRMGLCLYLYQQSRIFQNKDYEKQADCILDEIIRKLGTYSGVSFDDGLVGIVYAIDYLIKEKYVSGNIKTIFGSIDDKLFQYAYYRNIDPIIDSNKSKDSSIINLLWICQYYCKRILSKNLSKENEILIQRFLIECTNKFEKMMRDDTNLLSEPTFFSPFSYFLPNFLLFLANLYEMELYTYKVDMLSIELSKKLYNCIPRNYGNRCLLLYSIKSLLKKKQSFPSDFFENEKLLLCLTEETDLFGQFRCNDLSIRNGLSGLLLYIYNDFNFKLNIDKLERKIRDCIEDDNSMMWKNKNNYTLGDSIVGVIYMYQKIKMCEQ